MPKNSFWFRDGNFHLGRLFLILFAIEMAIFVYISSLNISNQALLDQFKNQQQSILSRPYLGILVAIFPNNMRIATLEFIPVYGILMFLESSYWTAVVIATEGGASTPGIVVFISLALMPHTWLELPAYAIATLSSIYLLYLLIKRKETLRRNIIKIGYLYLFVVVELAIAAVFETTEIYFLTKFSPYQATLYTFLLWIPGICVIVLLILWFRCIRKQPRKKEVPEEVTPEIWRI